jgi:predicted O-methyltransferase YrrM
MNYNQYIEISFGGTQNTSILGSKLQYLAQKAVGIAEKGLSGDIAECGVYKGGSARLLATIFNNKNILLFDSFEGMLESDQVNNGHQKGDFSDVGLSEVKSYLSDKTNCLFFPGWIPESAKYLTDEKFCFVHLDLDLYQSTKNAIEIFWPRLVPGGAMVFDDWEWQNCPGVKLSITEYFGSDLSKYQHAWDGNMCVLYKPENLN